MLKRWLPIAVAFVLLGIPVLADHTVVRQGRQVLSFDVPDLEPLGYKDTKLTRASFGREIGEGRLKITVVIKAWVNVDKLKGEYREDKQAQRLNQYSRLRDDPKIEGAQQTLSYSSENPYNSLVLICYTDDYRCEVIVTGTGEARDAMEPAYQQILDTLEIKSHSAISPIRVEPSKK